MRARVLIARSRLAFRHGDWVAGAAAARESVAVARDVADEVTTATALQHLGLMTIESDEPEQAERRLEESRELALAAGSRPLLVCALHSLAYAADCRGDWERGQALLERCLELLGDLAADASLALPLAFGIVVAAEGPAGTPRVLVERSLMQVQQLGVPQAVAHVRASLGVVHRNAGRSDAARTALEQGLAELRALGDAAGQAAILGHLGGLLRLLGDHDGARRRLEESLALHERLAYGRGIGFDLGNLALVAARAGDFDRARTLLDRAHRRFAATDDSPGLALMLSYRGYVAIDEGRADEARELLEPVSAMWDELRYRRLAAWIDVSLAVLAEQRGDGRRAQARRERAGAIFQALGNERATAWCARSGDASAPA
ncbi:MAG: tetratricopeptide repeat protein [Solirubrobacteraceae bacterium]|nr:tetratricopeptide repeat protein [Solirubrobacteraceae bacterium]